MSVIHWNCKSGFYPSLLALIPSFAIVIYGNMKSCEFKYTCPTANDKTSTGTGIFDLITIFGPNI